MSNNQKKKLAAQQHNEQYEQSNLLKFARKVSSEPLDKKAIMVSAMLSGLSMMPDFLRSPRRKSKSTKVMGY